MFYPFFYQFFTFEKPAFGTALIHFTENKKLTEKLRIINQLIRKSLHCIKYVRKRVLSERIFTYKNRIVSDSVLIREFKCQRKPVFLHILCWNVVNLLRFQNILWSQACRHIYIKTYYVQSVCLPGTTQHSLKQKHFHQSARSHATNNELTPNVWL